MAQMTLDQLVQQMQTVYREGLRCVVLYGSAARGESLHKKTTYNVLVIVDGITMEHLQRESPVAVTWREAGNPPPLTLTLEEWRGSADIFPMEYADILAHHKVLAGSLPVDGIMVDRNHLRLQLEHEAMSKLLRLRHAILTVGGDERAQRDVLDDSISSMMVLVRSAVRLGGIEPPTESEELLRDFEARTGVETGALLKVLRFSKGEEKLNKGETGDLLAAYLRAVEGLVRYVDSR